MANTLLYWRTISDEREKYAAYLCSPGWGAGSSWIGQVRSASDATLRRSTPSTTSPTLASTTNYRKICKASALAVTSLFTATRPSVWMRELREAKDHERVRELIRRLTIG